MTTVLAERTHPALTSLTEDERLFRETVRDFAQSEVGPRVARMDEAEEFDADLIRQATIPGSSS